MPTEIRPPPAVHLALPRIAGESPNDQHHQRNLDRIDSIISGETLPPYPGSESPIPRYVQSEFILKRPPSLTMRLFRAGFFFPPLWVLGSIPLLLPLPTPNSRSRMTDEYGRCILRQTELKWAKRCFSAVIFCICVCIAVGLSVWGILKNKKQQ
ncbi:hypothetical protein BDQ17DRAFT_1359374 [Cyathus striatus]|nr:hypothetical protein BDQ17DRAFT_1359374 [Cyathus striatus]